MAQFTPPPPPPPPPTPPPTPPPSPLPPQVHTHPFFRNVQKGDPLSKGTGLQTDFLEQTKEGTLDQHFRQEIQKAIKIAMKQQADKRLQQKKKMLALPVAQSGGGGGGGGGGSKVKQQSIARKKQMPALSVAQTGGGGGGGGSKVQQQSIVRPTGTLQVAQSVGGGGGATPQLKQKVNKQLKKLEPTQGSLLPNQILPQGTKRRGRK